MTLLLKRIIDLSSAGRLGPGLTAAVYDADGWLMDVAELRLQALLSPFLALVCALLTRTDPSVYRNTEKK